MTNNVRRIENADANHSQTELREGAGGVNLFHVANEVRKENRGACSMPTTTSIRQAVVTAPVEPVKVRITFRNPRLAAIAAKHFPQPESTPMGYEAGVTADQWEAFLAERAQEERDSWAFR
jgi:hypothetical protein